MQELSLEDLIKLELPDYKNLSFRISRHVMSGRGWEGFDDLIRFDDDLLTVFAGNMNEDRYKGANIVLTCVALPKSKALFRCAFINHGRMPALDAPNYYSGYQRYDHYLKHGNIKSYFNERVIAPPDLQKQYFYKFEQSNLLESYRNRLVLDWGKSQTYIQKKYDD